MSKTENGPFHDYKFPQNYADRKGERDLVTQIKTDESISPIPLPSWYWPLRRDALAMLEASGNRHYRLVDTKPLEDFTRERYNLGPNVGIVVGFEGSNELLERLFLGLADGTTIRTYGPYFTDRLKSIIYARRSKVQLISEPLTIPLDQALQKNIPLSVRKPADVDVIENPDVRGDIAELVTTKEYAEIRAKKKRFTIIDNTLGFVPDSESEATLVNDNEFLIVIQSFSKTFGFADDGVAILIANKKITDMLKEQMRHLHYRHADYKILYNMMAESGLLLPHLEDSRQLVRTYKPVLRHELGNLGVEMYPTSDLTPPLLINGKEPIFAGEVDLPITPGSGYYDTYESDPRLTNTPMTDAIARVGLPIIDYSDPAKARDEIRVVAKRIAGGINVAERSRIPEKILWIPEE